MASTFLTLPNPLVCRPNTSSLSSQKLLPGLRRNSLRVNAIAKKWEPTKVVPQADRVLIRLEQLPEQDSEILFHRNQLEEFCCPNLPLNLSGILWEKFFLLVLRLEKYRLERRFFSQTSMLMRWIWEQRVDTASAKRANC